MRADARAKDADLVAAAWRMFAEQGPDVSLRAIAAKAEVGIGTLYRHFPTKADLVAGIADEVGRRIRAICAAHVEGWDADPDAVWHGFVSGLADLQLGTLVAQATPAAGLEGGLPDEVVTVRTETLDSVEAVLGRARDAGLVTRDVTAMRLLVGVGTITRPLPRTAAAEPSEETGWLLRVYLRGLRP